MRLPSFLVLVSAVVTIAGCRARGRGDWPEIAPYCALDGPSRPVRGGDGPSLDELCRAVSERLCEQWSRCGCDTEDADVCRARVLDTCASFVGHADVRDAIARGTLEWSGAEARSFVDALAVATAACEPVVLDLSGAAIGRVGSLARCTDISGAFTECPDGSSCQLFSFGGPRGEAAGRFCTRDTGVTGRFQGRGEACDGYVGMGCAEGLRCAPVCEGEQFDGVCVDLLSLGDACRWDFDCASGYCAIEPGSSSDVYRQRGRCAERERVAIDGSCTRAEDCASGLCEGVRRGVPSFSSPVVPGTCAPLRADGEDCSSWLECESGACAGFREVDVGRCRETDAACEASSAGCTCVLRALRGRCAPPLEAGAPCEDSAECASRLCDAETGTCSTPLPVEPGEPCVLHLECGEGACIENVCREIGRALGEPCDHPEVCETRSCIEGVCAPAVCSARIDPTGHGSFWLRPPVLGSR